MKKFCKCLLRLCVVALVFASAFAHASVTQAETISSYLTNIVVKKNGDFLVQEKITYDFGGESKHGIYRDIPVNYKDNLGFRKSIHISDVSVVDERGYRYMFQVSQGFSNDEVKIGNKDSYVTGVHTYIITYTVANALSYFKDGDEIYWNAIGDKWQVPIQNSQVVVSLPQVIDLKQLAIKCYTGVVGSTNECPQITTNENNGHTQILFESQKTIFSGEAFTVAVGFPKGIVKEPSFGSKVFYFLYDYWPLIIPIVILVIMMLRWKKYGDDPKGRGTIIPQYDVPGDLSVLEIAAILNQKIIPADISANIISLATNGFIKIQLIEQKGLINMFKSDDYELIQLKELIEAENPVDKIMLERIFLRGKTVTVSTLKNEFYKQIEDIKKCAYKRLVEKEYYDSDPEKVKKNYISYAFGFIIGLHFFIIFFGTVGLISMGVSAAIVFLFAFIMPKKTQLGVDTRDYLLGLKDYLQIAEKDRIIFHNAPEKKPELFEKLLPVAMVMGVASIWAKEFEDIYMQPPQWYGGYAGSFNTVHFTHTLSNFNSYTTSTLASHPSGSGSHGGGSSGGGFGGGGGGSW